MDAQAIRREFVKLFGSMARYQHRYALFRDFVTMAGISLYNAIPRDQDLENEYLQIISRYEKPDQQRFPELLALVVEALTITPHDFMGSIFMELELGEKRTGQFFTPFELSRLLGRMLVGDGSALKDREFVTLDEPACGAGGMIIAYAEAMQELGMNPQQQLWFRAIDIDPVPAMMCYIQLSLLHIPGVVINGCGIRQTVFRAYRTPAHMLGFWEGKIKRHFAKGRDRQQEEGAASPTPVSVPVSMVPARGPARQPAPVDDQLSLFELF